MHFLDIGWRQFLPGLEFDRNAELHPCQAIKIKLISRQIVAAFGDCLGQRGREWSSVSAGADGSEQDFTDFVSHDLTDGSQKQSSSQCSSDLTALPVH